MRAWLRCLIFGFTIVVAGTAAADPASPPKVFEIDPDTVLSAKRSANPSIIDLAKADGERALKVELHSVMDKTQTPRQRR